MLTDACGPLVMTSANLSGEPIFIEDERMLSAMQGFFRGVGLVKITMIAPMLQMGVRCLLALILVPRLEIWGVCISVIAGWLAVCMFNGTNCVKYFRQLAKKQGEFQTVKH